MLQPTNLIVTQSFSVNSGLGTVQASIVDVCDLCGGLFARPGSLYYGMPHSH